MPKPRTRETPVESATPKAEEPAKFPQSQVVETTAIVQAVPVNKPVKVQRARWGTKKREALRLALHGAGPVEIAAKLGIHRNTVTNWAKSPEWLNEIRRSMGENQLSSKLRRVYTTTLLTDKLASHALKALDETDIDTTKAGLFLREHANYVKLEREQYGEQPGGGEGGHPAININIGGAPLQAENSAPTTASIPFKEFLDQLPSTMEIEADSPQEAVATLTQRALQDTELLDKVRTEDKADLVLEAEAEEAARRKR